MSRFNQVLYVAPSFENRKGGIASVLSSYSKSIEAFNFQSTAPASTTWINFLVLPFMILKFFFVLLLNPKFKIIHIHGASRGSFYRKYWIFLIAKKLFRKRVIYHIHGGEYHLFYKEVSNFMRRRISGMINGSDALIVLSVEWENYYSKTFNNDNIHIVNNIVEFPKRIPVEKNGRLTLVFLGTIIERKGIFNLLEAIGLLSEEEKSRIQLVVGGNGDIKGLNKAIDRLNLGEVVEFVGWIKGDEKIELLNKADLMILPSLAEGLPISLLEGMSYGLALVATDVGGIPQILKPNWNGQLIKPGEVQAIKKAIQLYLEEPDKIKQHGDNSLELAKDFMPDRVMSKLESIYSDLC